MNNGKLPVDAFYHYYALGPERSYQAVADHYAVSKTTVVKRAKKEDWQQRVEDLDRKALARAEEKVLETLDEMGGRHLKVMRAIQAKALEALKNMPLSTGMEAVRALEIAVKQERLIRGEPSDRTAVSVEDAIKREYQRWVVMDDASEDDDDENGEDCDAQDAASE